MIRTVLFDLDGTLLDTAPDLAAALNQLLHERGREALPFEQIRPVVSHGAIAMLRLAFDVQPGHPDYAQLRQRFLDLYLTDIAAQTRLFPGMRETLDALSHEGMRWGVVTNKPAFLTDPLMHRLGLDREAICVISGDTASHAKPHPAPMLMACAQAGCTPRECVYVGDAERDIEAGKAADMHTLVAAFGYIGANENPHDWHADALLHAPGDLLAWLSGRI